MVSAAQVQDCSCGALEDQNCNTPPPAPAGAALTNARLGRNPGQPQVEDHAPDIEHATDLGGEGGQRPPGWAGYSKAKHASPCPQPQNGIKNLGLGDIWVFALLYPLQWVLTSMPLWFCGARRGGNPETCLPLPCISCTPIWPEDGLQESSPLPNSKPRILCLAAPDTALVASCGPRAWHLGAAQPMPAEPMPYIQAEIRPQVAVTSASKFKAKPEAATEAEIPSQVLGWDRPCGRFLGPSIRSERLHGQWLGHVLTAAVQEAGPESGCGPLGVKGTHCSDGEMEAQPVGSWQS